MDTSERYVKMSFKAWPYLVKFWRWDIGDFFSDGMADGVVTGFPIGEKGIFPLPRQDQLIELLLPAFLKIKRSYEKGIERWYVKSFNNPDDLEMGACVESSAEQALLGMVIWQKFNKTWDSKNGDWI